jgi:hypothetical protein
MCIAIMKSLHAIYFAKCKILASNLDKKSITIKIKNETKKLNI